MISVRDGIHIAGLDTLADNLENAAYKYGWHSNKQVGYGHWNYEIMRVNKRNISPIQVLAPYDVVWNAVAEWAVEGAYPIRCYANCHTYGVEGYPHRDSTHDEETTFVLYVNREWKREWGGETAFYDGNEITKSVMPKYGRIVSFPSNTVHAARSVSRICPVSRRTFVLKVRHIVNDTDCIKLDNFLTTIGAGTKKHKHGSLKDHLIRTYELLKAKDSVPNYVALAGGLHSVYGTNAYPDACIHTSSRLQVVELFGREAEELAYDFACLQDRPTSVEEGISFIKSAIPIIEAANLYDQGSLKKYPNLHALWRRTS